jgi:hypothetical protein
MSFAYFVEPGTTLPLVMTMEICEIRFTDWMRCARNFGGSKKPCATEISATMVAITTNTQLILFCSMTPN